MERCPDCNCRLDLAGAPMEFENDDTPEKQTIAYEVMNQKCNNPECKSNGIIINKIRHRRD